MTTKHSSGRLPRWLKARAPGTSEYLRVRRLLNELRLHTVCESARCPNVGECWDQGTATFMILGDTCTRDCGFCAIRSGRPAPPDHDEPERVASAVAHLGLGHAVITSVTRDDLADGGARAFAATIRAVRRHCPDTTIEVLVPDFGGDPDSLACVLEADPQILNHNIETVARLYPTVRPQAQYQRSLSLLAQAAQSGAVATKSGMMLGVGESSEEVQQSLEDLRRAGCQILTLGQYLAPSPSHVPVLRFVPPEEFDAWHDRAMALGFVHVESGPLVRSSYHAAQQADLMLPSLSADAAAAGADPD